MVRIQRRSLLAAAAAVALAPHARAQPAPEAIALWPGAPPGGSGPQGPEQVSARGSVTNISRPRLLVHRPARPNGTAIVVASGGGYTHLANGTESTPAAIWLQSLGVTAFELIYRLPREGWSREAPFQDGQRAMRLVRAGAASWGINPARIGMMGFSAGGHLVGMTEVEPDAHRYPAGDATDTVSARPDFCALLYPVLSMLPPNDHTQSRIQIVGTSPSEAESAAWSVERHVTDRTPPTFLAQAEDDPISPIANSRMMYAALQAAHVPAELHIFEHGGHGWGMGRPGSEVSAWPAMFAHWAAAAIG